MGRAGAPWGGWTGGSASVPRWTLLALLAACGGDSSAAREQVAPEQIAREGGGALVVEIELPSRVAPGEPVAITLRARNTASEPVMVGLTGRPTAFDLVVAEPDGTEVWRRLQGSAVALVLELRRMEAGEALEFTDRWPQVDNAGGSVPPGRYTVWGELPLEGGLLTTEPRDLEIAR
jgi:hypothetical protein